MTSYVRWSGASKAGRSRVSAQPGATCDNMVKCIRYLSERGGSVFKTDLRIFLLKLNLGERAAEDTILMLRNFRFVTEDRKLGRLTLQDWIRRINWRLDEKEDSLLVISTGILSGGYRPESTEAVGEICGTRLIISGLNSIMGRKSEIFQGMASLDELAREIDEKGITSIFCTVKLLAAPTDKDPYSLGILKTKGSSHYRDYFVKLDKDALHSYQISIVSRYLGWIVPEIIQKKYGFSFEGALAKNLNLINAESIRQALRDFPPVWIGSDPNWIDALSMDGLIKDVTEFYGYKWWPEDRSGGGVGLFDDQNYVYVAVTKRPEKILLKNPYYGLF